MGINLWFEDDGEDFVEFDSMINVRTEAREPEPGRGKLWLYGQRLSRLWRNG